MEGGGNIVDYHGETMLAKRHLLRDMSPCIEVFVSHQLLQSGLSLEAVSVSQTLHFRSPVYIGDDILRLVQATAFRETKNKYIVKFSTKCIKNHNELVVLDGEATAILPNLEML
ncbi:unnamed protein product [Eruca vesicaria subsp. sativa]|uniref:Uncharacterized protein n=1 Tax=Eruca vesicaria subsp. sativa TaxID=29727 RepID=A0ABC8JM78_ERUVS|nr:unnamed protein product [Eruca vesicaria subsp. sativa]